MVMRHVVGITGAVLMAVTAAAQAPEDSAQRAAEEWLTLVDGGQYAASWAQAAPIFKNAVTGAQWEQAVTKARQPLRSVQGAQGNVAQYSTTLPGAPDGQYVVVVFESAFERKAAAVETAVMMLDTDGTWRVSGSFIR